jgi:hypothetical protein
MTYADWLAFAACVVLLGPLAVAAVAAGWGPRPPRLRLVAGGARRRVWGSKRPLRYRSAPRSAVDRAATRVGC